MGRIYRIVICILFLIPGYGWSQKMDCEQTIAYGTEEFNAGHFSSVPAILNECLTSFTREQKQRAFLLLTQTYLLLDDPIGAQGSFLEILWANPEFEADEQLHAIDIVYLSKRFTATPKFSWFVHAGSNVSPHRLILDNDIMQDEGEKYDLRPGYNFGVGGEYSYDDNIKVRVEFNYLHSSYRSQIKNYFDWDLKTFIDRQTSINVPLLLCYSDNEGTYRPYVYAGYSFSRLLSDRASITLREEKRMPSGIEGKEDDIDIFEAPSPDFNFFERRNKMNQSLIFGGGVKYKIGLDFVFAEARYSAGLKNIVNVNNAYGNYAFDQKSGEWILSFSPASEYAHVDDYLRLDNLSFTVGFLRPLYKPRELKRARTKGVLRKMKRSE
jgi:hypothetical protein